MTYKEYKAIYNTVKDLVYATNQLLIIHKEPKKKVPGPLLIDIIRLHNCAIDVIQQFDHLKGEEHDQ